MSAPPFTGVSFEIEKVAGVKEYISLLASYFEGISPSCVRSCVMIVS